MFNFSSEIGTVRSWLISACRGITLHIAGQGVRKMDRVRMASAIDRSDVRILERELLGLEVPTTYIVSLSSLLRRMIVRSGSEQEYSAEEYDLLEQLLPYLDQSSMTPFRKNKIEGLIGSIVEAEAA